MSGAVAVLASGGGGATAGGTTLNALAWTNISGYIFAGSNSQTIGGISTTVSISAAISGGGALDYSLNGAFHAYTGAFNVVATDTLSWYVAVGYGGGAKSGTITVTNATTATVVATISYSVTG